MFTNNKLNDEQIKQIERMQDKNAIDNFFEKKFLDGLYNTNTTVNCAIKNIPLIPNNKKIDFGNDNVDSLINQNQYTYLNELKKRINLNDSVNTTNDVYNNIKNHFLLNNNFPLNNSLASTNILNILKKNESNLVGNSGNIQDYLPSLNNILKNSSFSNRNNIININSINNINTINKLNDLNPNLPQNINCMNDNVLSQKDDINTVKNLSMPIFPTFFNSDLLNSNNNNSAVTIGNINGNSTVNNSLLNIEVANKNTLDYIFLKNDLGNINKSGIFNDSNSVRKNNDESNLLLGEKRGNNDI